MASSLKIDIDADLYRRLADLAAARGEAPDAFIARALAGAVANPPQAESPFDDGPSSHGARDAPFAALARDTLIQSPLRARITAACRTPETACVPPLMAEARLPAKLAPRVAGRAKALVLALRAKADRDGMEALIHEYDLSSAEGVALMCLAEALLRIPDAATRDALIRDKIGHGDWTAHLGHSRSLFVNAATWGLVVTGRLAAPGQEAGLGAALTRLVARGGEPLIRRSVDLAMRLMGEKFVAGETIRAALDRARPMEAKGFRHSYDMLGEAALTAADAARYLKSYENAVHAIGTASAGRGLIDGPGLSIKLSALHPRYCRAQRGRVMAELLPRLVHLVTTARDYDMGINIDAEEADRLDLSLDLLEALCFTPALAGWDGIGFVVQAYQKRAPFVIDFLVDLARRSGRRLMVRLVKGAYWDSEIKRAQVDGLEGFPVFTRKVYTDVSYLACARRLLAAPDAVFPQFATHNAQTLSAIMALAGEDFRPEQYEFQCLHGMGEPLYEEVVGPEKLGRPCRIYAPVGTHETLLAYLVRRLLENGANSSFVNRIADPAVPVEALIADPVEEAAAIAPPGAPHPRIAAPRALFPDGRVNARGLDLCDESRLRILSATLLAEAGRAPCAAPLLADGGGAVGGAARPVANPANPEDIVGHVIEADAGLCARAVAAAAQAGRAWSATPAPARAALLEKAADLLEARMEAFLGLMVREAGKSLPNAIGEVREAVDFLRYSARAAATFTPASHPPLGPVVAISPWNFPLSIFTGQIAAALAAGNPVIAKPAEETPLTGAALAALLHEAGVPRAALQFLPGDGRIGAALVAAKEVAGVLFTGSTEVACAIRSSLAGRTGPNGQPVALIAETGGLNAMVVDSSALPEQVVADALLSAFDYAGQRCSALRLLCLQEEIAERTLAMLRGAMAELRVGDPARLDTDIGPVISEAARAAVLTHIGALRGGWRRITEAPLGADAQAGIFVAPTLIEIETVGELTREVFGPVLHVVRYRRERLAQLLAALAGSGYALTFGLHTRIAETVDGVVPEAPAGNIYVNRSMIGAVVGVQPFGGHGLSGTGPKAGGPLYLRRLAGAAPPLEEALPELFPGTGEADAALAALAGLLAARGEAALAARASAAKVLDPSAAVELPGPVGETNRYGLRPRGRVLCLAETLPGLGGQLIAALRTGNSVLLTDAGAALLGLRDSLPPALSARIEVAEDEGTALARTGAIDAILLQGDAARLRALDAAAAERAGPLVAVQARSGAALAAGGAYLLDGLVQERTVTVNTAAAGGNASLMTLD